MLALLTLGACQRSETPGLRGSALPDPLPKPDVTLTGVDGKPFAFREATRDKLTLLFFGYTSCPDVCPMHMANIAAVLRDMPFAWQDRVKVVFVSVDPKRDSPARIKEWLANFNPAFVGVTGPTAVVDAFERALYLPEAVTIPAEKPGDYTVGHAAQVIAFTEDGLARYVYPFGTRQEDWAHDLPILLGATPRAAPAPRAAAEPAGAAVAPRLVTALVPLPPGNGPGALYAVFAPAAAPDRLVGVASPLAARMDLHTQAAGPDGRMAMRAVSEVTIAPGERLRLVPGGYHAMFYDAAPLTAGASFPVTFTFAAAGTVTAAAKVVPYAEIERLLGQAEGARP